MSKRPQIFTMSFALVAAMLLVVAMVLQASPGEDEGVRETEESQVGSR